MSDTPDASLALPTRGRRVLGEWTVADLTGLVAGGVSLWLERERDGATLQIVVAARGRQALVDTPMGSVLYHKHSGLTEREAGEVTRAFAALLESGEFQLGLHFPHLLLGSKVDDAARARVRQIAGARLRSLPGYGEAAAPTAPPREFYFDPPGIAEFLAPDVAVDGAPVGGFTLRAVYLPATGKRGALDFRSYDLEFVDAATAESVRLRATAGAEQEGFGRAGEVSLAVLGFTQELDALPPRVASLCSWVLAILQLKTTPGLRLKVPAGAEEVRALAHPSDRGKWASPAPEEAPSATGAPAAPLSLNLAIDTECGQRCSFCSVKAYVRPLDEGDAALERIRVQLRMARDQGVREVRINGIDPLTFSRILEVLDAVRECGFPKLWVYSPCRRLADPEFRREFLRRMPAEFVVSVPLYGVTADVHEAVTGTPGSFAEVKAALEGLLAEAPAGSVIISTVVVKQNLAGFADVVAYAVARGLAIHPHLPYPMRQTTRDPYAESALREQTLVDQFVAGLVDRPVPDTSRRLAVLGSAVPHPCLLWRAEKKHRLPVFGARAIHERQPLAGTEYRSRKILHDSQGAGSQENAFAVATVPCPHVERCALASVCPGEHYGVYRSLYGLDEFTPVSVAELYAAAPLHQSERPSRA